MIRLGSAGWSIPRTVAGAFPTEGTGLERYAAVFDAVEINTTFYRPHRPQTFERWASAVPSGFRFAVKAPKAVTHERRLVDASELMAAFLEQLAPLGDKLGPVLVQLPPSLAFDPGVAGSFFEDLRGRHPGSVALEPRHASWFEAEADVLLAGLGVARVAADPARVPAAAEPGGDLGRAYFRWHGSPAMYRSGYDDGRLEPLAARLAAAPAGSWMVFDNTTLGHAAADALTLKRLLAAQTPPR
jgi:uncharacterized protein YecE (DUF72 family)